MKKALSLLLTFVLFAGLFAGCATNAEPGDNTRDGIIGGSYEDTDRYERNNRRMENNRDAYNGDYKKDDNKDKDYNVTDGVLTDRNKNSNTDNKNDLNTGNAGTNAGDNAKVEPSEQNNTNRAS